MVSYRNCRWLFHSVYHHLHAEHLRTVPSVNVRQLRHVHLHRHSHKQGSDLTDEWLRIKCCHYSWNLKLSLKFTRICRMWQSQRDWIWLIHTTSAYAHPTQAEEYTEGLPLKASKGERRKEDLFTNATDINEMKSTWHTEGVGVALKLPVVPHHLLPI